MWQVKLTAAVAAVLVLAALPAGEAGARAPLLGTLKADRLIGGSGPDRIEGRRGNDLIKGRRGDDFLSGGPGRDKLVGGPGRDRLSGDGGGDLLSARDGKRDRIRCGPGRDKAVLDVLDVIADASSRNPKGSCEAVDRPAAKHAPIVQQQATTRSPGAPFTQPIDPPFDPSAESQVLAAGDIADCTPGAEATAEILDRLPGVVATLGDNVYETGTPEEFAKCYAPTWGRHRWRTMPAVGDHEYKTPGAAGYFAYFGRRAGEPGKGYYSYDVGSWHVVVVNSGCDEVGGCYQGSPEEQWLRADLTAHPSQCTLAYWHSPRFSSGELHGDNTAVQPFWQALFDNGVELILSGNDHHYERFAPRDANGVVDTATGVRQFVVGTGGRYLRPLVATEPSSEASNDKTFGILRLKLDPASYDWEFIPQAGATFTDSGTTACH